VPPRVRLDQSDRHERRWNDHRPSRPNDYALVLQAAMAGEGIVLGWEHICRLPMAQGLIAPVGPWTWDTGAGFYLVWSERDALSDRAAITRDWILSKAISLTC
jgi:DNA-binding transcriptional LysR family regulator